MNRRSFGRPLSAVNSSSLRRRAAIGRLQCHTQSQRTAGTLAVGVRDVTGTDAFEVTQEVIAEMLRVGRTSVSITAHHLQRGGLIKYRRGKIQITNLEGLRAAACECQGAIRACGERWR